MQSVSYRIWTRVTESISYDDNRYTTGTSTMKFIIGAMKGELSVGQSVAEVESIATFSNETHFNHF